MLDRTNHHFSGRSPILFFNSGMTSLFWYTAIAHGTMAWDCFPCHQPLCLQGQSFSVLFDVIHTGIFVFQWIDEFENYILVIGLKFFQKLLRLRCSLMNSGKSPCRYILMYNGSFTCLTMSKEVLESISILLLNQNDKNWFRLCL
jgi:hypothetical protein